MHAYVIHKPPEVDLVDLTDRLSRALGMKVGVGKGEDLVVYTERELTATELDALEKEVFQPPPLGFPESEGEVLRIEELVGLLRQLGIEVRLRSDGLLMRKASKSSLIKALTNISKGTV